MSSPDLHSPASPAGDPAEPEKPREPGDSGGPASPTQAPSPSSGPWGWSSRALGLFLLILLPFGLRLGAADHGFPDNYVPDTHVVRGALGMAKDKHPVPPAGMYSSYPNLLPYTLLPIYATQYALGRATGAWSGSGEFAQAVAAEPWRVHLPARLWIASLGAAAAFFTYRGLRAAGLRSGAWFGAYLVGTCLLHVHLSTHERPWAPVASFTALAAWPGALFVRDGRARHLILSALAAALAFASHQGGAIALGVTGLAWLFGPWTWRPGPVARRIGLGFAAVGAFVLLALIAGHPYYLVHGAAESQNVIGAEALAGRRHIVVGGIPIILEVKLATLTKLSRALAGYDPVLVLLGLAGLIPALLRRSTRPMALFAALAGAFFLFGQSDHVRYLLPATLLLAWPAALAAERLWSSALGRPVLLMLLAVPLVQSLRLVWVLGQDDTRVAIREQLERFRPNARLAVDVAGPDLPLNQVALERLATLRELGTRERMRLAQYEASIDPGGDTLGGAWDAIDLADLFEFEYRYGASWPRPGVAERYGNSPKQIFKALGVTHVLVVDKTPGDDLPPLLLSEAEPDQSPDFDLFQHASGQRPKLPALRVPPRSLLEQLCSPDPTQPPPRAQLPTEMDFALTDLWRVERPGPQLSLYRFIP